MIQILQLSMGFGQGPQVERSNESKAILVGHLGVYTGRRAGAHNTLETVLLQLWPRAAAQKQFPSYTAKG